MKIQQSSIERATVFHGQNSMRSLRRPPRSAPTAVKERFRGLLRDEGIAELEAPETNRVPRRYYREFRDTTTFAEPAAALDLSPFVLAGVAVPYDSLSCDLGGWRERIMPGAFADAIRNRTADTLAVVEHDTCKLFGRLSSGTLKLTDLPDGVHVTVDLPSTSI
ncbi:MAG TPA: HK97 family phage prohead protease, partial [Pirellulales bacterium]|nr:HK97 family phage prohead protease [Pirellulales bacterium]